MRIAFINSSGSASGGAEESLRLLLTHLPPEIAPLFIAFDDGEYAERLRSERIPTYSVSISATVATSRRDGPLFRAAIAVPLDVLRLARRLRSLKVDAVHTNTVKAHVVGILAARLCGLPSVMHLRDMVPGRGRGLIGFFATRLATKTVCVSRAVARWYGLSESSVIANPVDISTFHDIESKEHARSNLGLSSGIPLLGMIGRINRWKGHDRFIRIVAEISKTRPVRAIIVGEARFRDADFVPELHQLIETLGLRDAVRFLPWADDPRRVYTALDVHCNCSEREPFGRNLIEAGACGTPTIAFDDGAANEIIDTDEDGIVVPAGDETAFASALEALLADDAKLERLSRNARTMARRYDVSTHVLAMLRVFSSLSNEPERRSP